MFTRLIRTVALAFVALGTPALAFVALGTPALALSGPTAQTVTFDTAFTERYDKAGADAGVLKLTFAPSGVVSGYYRNADAGDFVPVTGGVSGDRIHLDFYLRGAVHIEGTYDGKTISGSTVAGNQIYDFDAAPESK